MRRVVATHTSIFREQGGAGREVTTVGIDVAKHLFQVHGVDERGRVVLSRRVTRSQLAEAVASLPRWVMGMEACASAHHCDRAFVQLGPPVQLMSPT